MAVKIRLRQQGRKNRKVYRLVVIDTHTPRDGKYIECIGTYDPHREDGLIVKSERAEHWLNLGAEVSEKSKALIAKSAPAVIKNYTAKQVAHRAKEAAKRKARAKK